MSDAELNDFLNRMLEAERAGARALVVFMDDWPRHGAEWQALRKVHEDEAHNCALIGEQLKRRPEIPASGPRRTRATPSVVGVFDFQFRLKIF